MYRICQLSLLVACLCVAGSTLGFGQEQPAETPEQALARAAELQKTADEAAAQKQTAEQQLSTVEARLLELQQMTLKLQRELQQAQSKLKEGETNLAKQQEEATKTATAKADADKAAADAATALAEAQKKAEETKVAAEAATKAAEAATAAVATTQQAIEAAKTQIAAAETSVAKTAELVTAEQTSLASASTALATVSADWLGKAKAVESALKTGGQWISFSHEVAPIFYQRCLACHNARTAKGRFNMESFAAIMKGGESGAAIEPGKGGDSNLCIQIADGSMPQDADPLTAEQIALVQRWVDLGARLDAGVSAASPLLQIIPKVPQPAAPQSYPVAIPVTALAFSPDGAKLASSGYHEVILWNVADHTVAQRITNVAERVYDVAFHADGQRIAIASGTPGQAGEVKIFNLADGALLADFVTVEDAMFGVAFSPDGTKLAACGADRSVRVFDVATSKQEVHVEDHADWVMDINWSPDGARLVSASRDKTSKVFDAKTGDSLATFNGHGEPVNSAVFLPDGTAVASSARDKTVRIWSLGETAERQGAAAPKEIRKIGGYGDDVLRLVILPDNRLFSVSADKQARSHNAADGAAIKSYAGHSDWIYSLAVHPASGMLATGSYDGEVRLWKIDDATSTANWTAAPGYTSQQAAAN
jgi:hypothetical protein